MPRDGELLGGYHFVHKLGEGPTGTVWLAREQAGALAVTIKLLKAERFPPSSSETSYERLIEALNREGRLAHPGLAAVRTSFHQPRHGQHGLVSEFCEGGVTLERAPIPPPADGRPFAADPHTLAGVLSWFLQLAQALSWLHKQGFAHGAVQASNVLLLTGYERAQVKLLDLTWSAAGLEELLPERRPRAPELARGARPTPAADQWAFGHLLKNVLSAGKAGGQQTEALAAAPVGLLKIVKRTVEPDPARRYMDMGAVFYAVEELLKELESRAAKKRAPSRIRWDDKKRISPTEEIALPEVAAARQADQALTQPVSGDSVRAEAAEVLPPPRIPSALSGPASPAEARIPADDSFHGADPLIPRGGAGRGARPSRKPLPPAEPEERLVLGDPLSTELVPAAGSPRSNASILVGLLGLAALLIAGSAYLIFWSGPEVVVRDAPAPPGQEAGEGTRRLAAHQATAEPAVEGPVAAERPAPGEPAGGPRPAGPQDGEVPARGPDIAEVPAVPQPAAPPSEPPPARAPRAPVEAAPKALVAAEPIPAASQVRSVPQAAPPIGEEERDCIAGKASACAALGDKLARSGGRAVDAYDRACGLGARAACPKAAELLLKEGGGKRARVLYERACDKRDGRSCEALARLHQEGIGGAVNERLAKALLLRACGYGRQEACAP